MCDVVLQRGLIEKVDPKRGCFRTFLLSALGNFEIDAYRQERGRNGQRPKTIIPEDAEQWRTIEPSESDDPADAFERQWAATIFAEALQRTEQSCLANGMEKHWRAYEARYVLPALHGVEAMSLDSLVTDLEADAANDVSSMIHSAKRKFRVVLREVIAETLDDPSDVDAELAMLRSYLDM
ncbi:MAG: hypothetical protein O7G85_06590 [Planctomycetota bacterium]|nr:hypothetical protein [Planctomycetota bacterium]